MIDRKKPISDKDYIMNGLSQEHRETMQKMYELTEFFTDDEMKSKPDKVIDLFIDYCNIIYYIESENKDYSDRFIISRVNNLYKKTFRNRRY